MTDQDRHNELMAEIRYVRGQVDSLRAYIGELLADANEVHHDHDKRITVLQENYSNMIWAAGKVAVVAVASVNVMAGLVWLLAKKVFGL